MTEAAFYLCAYEFAIKSVNSPWCQLFDEDDAKVRAISGQLYVPSKHATSERQSDNVFKTSVSPEPLLYVWWASKFDSISEHLTGTSYGRLWT